MPIAIIDAPEPLSEESLRHRGSTAEPLLVESSASRVLRQELQRYCEGKINGRSFLIAGHRGAGKTTLVAKAFMDVHRLAEDGAAMRRPLFIALHGPSLFPNPAVPVPDGPSGASKDRKETLREAAESQSSRPGETQAEKAQAERVQDKKGQDEGKDRPAPQLPGSNSRSEKSEAQIALEQITLGLHRAVAREFSERYRDRASSLSWLRRTQEREVERLRDKPKTFVPSPDSIPPDEADLRRLLEGLPSERELFELAAQFEVELYESPPVHRLRQFWERLRALSGGILFRGGYSPLLGKVAGPEPPPGMFLSTIEVHAQGARELVALAGVLEAYRRISGDYKRSEGEKRTRQDTAERVTGFEAATKELAAPIAALLTGGLAGTGLALAGAEPGPTFLGGIAAALGASLVFKATTTRKRDRSASSEYQFVYDLSVSTLDRILPILIERLNAAGLAPVFVVDELDKVLNLSSRIVTMVHHLKKLVAENAFFCFLTNRSYFEEMLAEGSGRPYPVEYTYYTHRLFVVFAPEDFERYLRKRIPRPAVAPSSTPDARADVEPAAHAILLWALRHRSQLHMVDLQREIAALRNDEGQVRTPPELLTGSLRNLIDMTFQVGIELTLGQPDVEQLLLDRPEFRRLMHDAMYYLSRQWLDGRETVHLSAPGRVAFLHYLERRTGREEERTAAEQASTPQAAVASVAPKDLEFLFGQVAILADFLCDRPSIEPVGTGDAKTRDWRKERLADWNERRKSRGLAEVEPDVLDALLVGERTSILLRAPNASERLSFRHPVAVGTQEPVSARVAEPPVSTVPPAEDGMVDHPTPPSEGPAAGPPDLEWEPRANFIDAFAEALNAATSPRASRRGSQGAADIAVTLDALAGRFRIMTPSPTWSVTRAAIARLRDAASRGTRHPGYAEDVFLVNQFHDILVRNGEQIVRALLLGAVVGKESQGGVGARIANGLAIIARAMQFASKREEDVGRSLENVMAMMRDTYNADFETLLEGFRDDWPEVKTFVLRMRAGLEQAAALRKLDSDEVVTKAWSAFQSRLAHWVTTNEVPEPQFEELLVAAVRRGPTELVEFDPREMTLQQWAKALVAARTGPHPWLTLFAWHALGFRSSSQFELQLLIGWASIAPTSALEVQMAGANQLFDRTVNLVNEHKLLSGRPPATILIMLRRKNSPMTATWRPVPDAAVLLISADELKQFSPPEKGEAMGQPALALPLGDTTVCAVEMDPELAANLYTSQLPFLKQLLKNPWLIYVYDVDRGREMKAPNVVAPQDPLGVIEAASRTRSPLPEAGLS
jgi:hypothetical protein